MQLNHPTLNICLGHAPLLTFSFMNFLILQRICAKENQSYPVRGNMIASLCRNSKFFIKRGKIFKGTEKLLSKAISVMSGYDRSQVVGVEMSAC